MNTTTINPKVLLVGRTNVGKSTLFNRLTEQKRSLVFDREGVTRDYVQEQVSWSGKTFDLVDTGGLTFSKGSDVIGKQVQEKVLTLLNQAALLLFVVDGKHGLVDEDVRIARILRKTQKPVILVVNKADNLNAIEEHMPDFYTLGFNSLITASGIHGMGIADLLKEVAQIVPFPTDEVAAQPSYKVVIIGKPNVGKSSLMNLLIQHERSIVSNIAGTTREAISETVYHCNDLIQVTDTAGVRRSRKVEDSLEELMVKSSLQAVRDADVVVVMIDASEGKIADQELKLLFYAYEQKKMLLVVFNKIDLLDDYKQYTLEQSIAEYEFIFKKIPSVWISCVTQKNISNIFNAIHAIWERCTQRFNEQLLDETVKKHLEGVHLYHTAQELKVSRIRPNHDRRIPTFTLHVNHPRWFGPTELGCIENILRKSFDLQGCPVAFILRESKK